MTGTSGINPLNVVSTGGNIALFSATSAGAGSFFGLKNISDNTLCYFGLDGGGFFNVSPGACMVGTYAGNAEFIIIGSANIMYRMTPASIIPQNVTYSDLGSTANGWNNLFIKQLNRATGCSEILVNASLVPTVADKFDLGTQALPWNNLFVNRLSTPTGEMSVAASLVPTLSDTFDLGTQALPWNNLFVNRLNASSGGGTILVNGSLIPTITGTFDLGSTGSRWNNIYLCNAPITSSDERNKSNIEPSDLGLSFIEKLKPVKYNFIGGHRTHYGLTTQQVKRTLEDLSCHDFAGFVLANKDDPESVQMLRYEEFISPIIQSIQDLKEIVNRQQKQIEELQSRV